MRCDDASRMNVHTRFGIELFCSEQTPEIGMYAQPPTTWESKTKRTKNHAGHPVPPQLVLCPICSCLLL